MAFVDWKISTKQIGTCSCDYGCPCEFNAPPTRLPCEGVMAMEITEGYFGKTRLDGLRVAGVYRWPGAVHEGNGVLKTQYGDLDFGYGDYLVIPRGSIYQIEFTTENNRLFIVESFSPIRYPKKYLSKLGQLMEHSPYCERDIRPPHNLQTHDETGDFLIKTKKKGILYGIHYAHHPFDVVGWDGCCYPFAFSIHDFEPITGRVHQPPPVHQTFEAHNFVVCSFCPRLFDYHPQSIPAPYNHSNIDSDEVLYYVDGDFMSRKHVTRGMITLHPAGIPHGPHPGAVKKSIGAKATNELAVMVDTFHPLQLTKAALEIENEGYVMSWAE